MIAAAGKLAGWKGYAAASLVGAAVIVAGVSAWSWRWTSGYAAGHAAALAEVQTKQAAIERGMQVEKDREDAIHRGAILAREASARDLASARARLDRLLREHGSDPANPRAGRGLDGSGPDWIAGFAECYAAYGDLASDAARWADQVNALQGYVKAIRSSSERIP